MTQAHGGDGCSGGHSGPCCAKLDGPETADCCCCCYCCSCSHLIGAKGDGSASNLRRTTRECNTSAHHESGSGDRNSPNACRMNQSTSCCEKQNKVDEGSRIVERNVCCSKLPTAARRGDPTASSTVHKTNAETDEAPEAAAPSSSCVSSDGCGSTGCIMTNGARPKRLCICMVSDFFFPSLGGVEMHIYELSVRLARKGFKVVVVTHAIDGRHGIRHLSEGIKVYYLPLTCFHDRSTLVTFFTTLPLIRTILIREKVDIVHGHQTTSTLAHESMFHARHLGYRFYSPKYARLIVVYTDHSMFSFADAACIHMNKDVPAYVPDLSKRPQPPAINILILSRLSYRKGIDLLVDMIPAVCSKYPNVTFIIGGDGPKRIILEEMREKHRIHDRVEMLGAVPHGQACSFLQRGQIFLNASLTESFCIAIVEAAACGLVVVSTDVGGIPEVLPPDMVLLAPPNPAALTLQLEEAISRVEKGDIDPHAVHKRVLEMYSWEDVADRVEQVYFSALFDLPMSAHLRSGISLANVPLPPNPPPLPTPQGAVQVLRALNRDSIEEAASFPSDVLDAVEESLMSPP